VPETSKDAFESAERIFFELDLTDQNTLSTLDACQYLPDNQDLTQIFPADLISSINHHLDKVKQDLPEWMYQDPSATEQLYSDRKFSTLTEGWERKHPIWVSLLLTTTLTQGYFSKDGPPSSALDLYMIEEAKKRGKEVGAIEFAEEHCQALNGIDSKLVEASLQQTLNEKKNRSKPPQDSQFLPKSFPDHSERKVSHAERLESELSQAINKNLFLKRNGRMAARVIDRINNNPNNLTTMFVFGAGHFLGDNSVVEILKDQGFNVRQVPVQTSSYQDQEASFFREQEEKDEIDGKTHFTSANNSGPRRYLDTTLYFLIVLILGLNL
jgi:uncharacterized protein YbaP (TraB family)